MKQFQEEHVNNLPDVYRKDVNSNNYKILQVEKVAVSDLKAVLENIKEILDINNAYGKTLDMYGERVGQGRGVASDEQYLLLIKSKIIQNLSNGTHQNVVEGLCYTLNCEASQVIITDGEDDCSVNVLSIPLETITKAEMTTSQVLALIKRMLPAGVKLESFLFEGTFEFSVAEDDYDEEKGFCDIEGGTLGGYLGVTTGDTTDTVLPI